MQTQAIYGQPRCWRGFSMRRSSANTGAARRALIPLKSAKMAVWLNGKRAGNPRAASTDRRDGSAGADGEAAKGVEIARAHHPRDPQSCARACISWRSAGSADPEILTESGLR